MPPLVWPLLCLVAGILGAPYLDLRYAAVWLPLTFLVAWLRPKLALIAIGLGGAILASLHQPAGQLAIRDDGLPRRVLLRLGTAPAAQGDGAYFLADVLEADDTPVSSGRARLTWFPDDYGSAEIFRNLRLGRGDVVEVVVRLRRPNHFQNPGVFDYRRFLERRGIYWTGTIRSPRLITIVERAWHGPDRARDWIANRIARYFPDPTLRSLVLGMVLGRRRLLPPEDARKFEEAGLTHLLVVSGFNLAVVAAVAVFLGGRLFAGRYRPAAFTLILLFGYALLVEGGPPVLRATLMASMLVAGKVLDRGYSVGNALAGTALVILVLDTRSLWDASFLLSFGAVAAIVLLSAPLVSWTHSRMHPALRQLAATDLDRHLEFPVVDLRVRLRCRAELTGWPVAFVALPLRAVSLASEIALITAGIQLFLLPSAIESFHRVSPASLPLNVLGAVVASLVTPTGLGLIVLPEFGARPLAWALAQLLELLVAAVGLALEVPGATTRVPSAPPGVWLVFAAALGCLTLAVKRRHPPATIGALLAALSLVLAMVLADFSPAPAPNPVLTFLDVGQGDSILVEMPDGHRMIVDGGGLASSSPDGEEGFRIGEEVVSQYLFSRRFRRIDTLVLTHAHHDHMDGLFDLIRNFRIGEIWLGPNPMTPRYRALLDLVYESGIPIREVRAGDRSGAFEVLHPRRDQVVKPEVRNDDSLVLLLDWFGRLALLTGDFEGALELESRRVDVLKIPHHGSPNGRARMIRARIPVISVGANNGFGHPAPEWLPALRTDLLGAIEVTLAQSGPSVRFPGLD